MTTETEREERLSGIGGGGIATIAGLNPYQSPYQLWEILTRKREPESPSPQMRRGLRLEPYVNELYREESGLVTSGPVFIRDASDPWIIGHLDNLAGPEESAWDRVQDSKTTRHELRRMWGEPGSADVPLPIQAQMHWYMLASKKSLADVAACFGFDDFAIFQIPEDKEVQEQLYAMAYRFWHEHVLADVPPPLEARDASRVFTKDSGLTCVATDDIVRRVARLAELKAQRKVIDDIIEQNEGEVKLAMGDAALLKSTGGDLLATWKASKPAERLDIERLRRDHPAIAAAYTVTGKAARRFLLK